MKVKVDLKIPKVILPKDPRIWFPHKLGKPSFSSVFVRSSTFLRLMGQARIWESTTLAISIHFVLRLGTIKVIPRGSTYPWLGGQ